MNFNSFYDPEAFQTFADSMFRTLKNENIPNLIIDIRKNGGGSSFIGDELFQYISPVPFLQFEKMIVRTTPTTLKLKQQLYGQLSKSDSIYGITSYDVGALKELRENDLRYKGNVYLLISHFTFSSASSFSWTFKQFGMGTVSGEESGGMGVCFGDVLSFYLPNSDLCCGISHKKFYQYGATEKDNHGTLPHYNIPEEDALEWTINNLIDKNTGTK